MAHVRRDRSPARFPQHITLRILESAGSARRRRVMRVVRQAIRAGGHRVDFRVVEFSVQSNHMHLIVEASGAHSLTRGMIGLEVRLARRINRVLARRGSFFADRYHARPLRTPTEVRAALRYVLFNHRHHARSDRAASAVLGVGGSTRALDPCSSAVWFDGWDAPFVPREAWHKELLAAGRPHARATVWLLTTGWRRGGLLATDEQPRPRR